MALDEERRHLAVGARMVIGTARASRGFRCRSWAIICQCWLLACLLAWAASSPLAASDVARTRVSRDSTSSYPSLDPIGVDWTRPGPETKVIELSARRSEGALIEFAQHNHRDGNPEDFEAPYVGVVTKHFFGLDCEAQVPRSEVRELARFLIELHENKAIVLKEIMSTEKKIKAWEDDLRNDDRLQEYYAFPHEVLDAVSDIAVGGFSESVSQTQVVVQFDMGTQKSTGNEMMFLVSSECHRMKVRIHASGSDMIDFDTHSCPAVPQELTKSSMSLSFASTGGVNVVTIAGSGTPYNHSALKQGGPLTEFTHAHKTRVLDQHLRHSAAQLSYPWGCAFSSSSGSLFVTNSGPPESSSAADDVLIELRTTGFAHVVAGGRPGYRNGKGRQARLRMLAGATWDTDRGQVYIAEVGNSCIRGYDVKTQEIYLLAGKINAKVADEEEHEGGFADGPLEEAQFNIPQGITYTPHAPVGSDKGVVFIADTDNHRIRVIDLGARVVSTLAGGAVFGSRDGPALEARMRHPVGVAYDRKRQVLYVCDHYNHRLRYVTWDSASKQAVMHTLAGRGGLPGNCPGLGPTAAFNHPEGLWVDEDRAVLFVADYGNNAIRAVAAVGHANVGLVSTLVGAQHHGLKDGHSLSGNPPQFSGPSRICGSHNSSTLYVVDQMNHRIRELQFDPNAEPRVNVPVGRKLPRVIAKDRGSSSSGMLHVIVFSVAIASIVLWRRQRRASGASG